jgi:hypothetical protein
MTTQRAVVLLCCMEETRREANRLPKNKRRSVWMKRCGARHTSSHGFLKRVSHVLTIKELEQSQWDTGIMHTQAEMLVCIR